MGQIRYILFFILFSAGLVSCSKVADVPGEDYEGQEAPYCNDPEAINYNHTFPGTADNTTCIFPTDPFKGTYALADTVYTADYADYYILTDTVTVYPVSKTRMALIGFCGPSDSLTFTAGRYYRATMDSTTAIGQLLCNPKDTVSGILRSDSIGLRIDFTLHSDTAGTKYHRGTGTRIQ